MTALPLTASPRLRGTELGDMSVLLAIPDAAVRAAAAEALGRGGFRELLDAPDPSTVLRQCLADPPDAVLLDLDAAVGLLDELAPLTEEPESLPVIGLTADLSADARRRALSLGVHDFAAKPVDDTELSLRVRNVLQARRLRGRLAERDARLREALRDRGSEPDAVRESLSVLAAIADYHDDDTYQHAQRVGNLAAAIARTLGCPEAFVTMLRDAAPLHDIGKVGMSRRILLKPGKLTPAEWMHMMRHVEIGGQILSSARSPVLRLAAEIARTHHERWNGSGYLSGLVGEEIPLGGRITALADVWDTLTHERPYKPAWDEERALNEVHAQAGEHFDPAVVAAFDAIDRAALELELESEQPRAA